MTSSPLWDKYQAKYRRATGMDLPDGQSALDAWTAGSSSPSSNLPALRGTGGVAGSVANASITGDKRTDSELREAQSLQNAVEGAGESVPEQALGFAEGAMNFLDRGRAAITGGVSGYLNLVGRGLEAVGVDNGLDEWTAEVWNGQTGDDYQPDSLGGELANSPFGRAWRGLAGAEKYGVGDFEGPLKFQEDDSFGERALKSGLTFVSEVGLDPLTYLTFGVGSVGKQAASFGVKGAVKAFASTLDDDALRALASRNTTYNGLKEAAETAGRNGEVMSNIAARKAAREAENLAPEELAGATEKAAKSLRSQFGDDAKKLINSREGTLDYATDQLIDEVGTAFFAKNGRGLRQYLENHPTLTREQADQLWNMFQTEAKGGARFQLPFTKQSTRGIAGGLDNSVLDKMGLGKVADATYAARGAISTSKPVSAVRRRVSGQAGEAMDNALKEAYGAAKTIGQPTNGAFTSWIAQQELAKVGRTADAMLSARVSKAVYTATQAFADLAPEQRRAAENFRATYFMNPSAAAPTGADAAELAGYESARILRESMDNLFAEAKSLGIQVDEIKDYVPRIMTEEARDARIAKKAETGRGKGTGNLDPTKSREAFADITGVDDNGNLILNWQAIDRINEKSLAENGYKMFEDDPVVMFASYGKAMSGLISTRRFMNELRGRGLLIDGGTTTSRRVSANAVADAVQAARSVGTVSDEAATAARTLDGLLDDGTTDVAVITKPAKQEAVEAMDEVLGEGGVAGWLRSLPEDPKARDEMVNTLMSAVRDVHRARVNELEDMLAEVGPDSKEWTKIKKRIELAEKTVADSTMAMVTTKTAERAKLADYLFNNGWDLVGVAGERARTPNLNVPGAMADDAYLNRFARSLVEAHFAVRDPDTLTAKVLEFMTPLLSFWKTWATVGRGTGYLSRNLIGGAWNNLINGIERADYADSIRVLNARARAAGRLADEKKLLNPWDEEQLLRKYVKEELGDERLWEVYKGAERQGLFVDTSRVEYLMSNGILDGDHTQYLLAQNAKQPKIGKNYRYGKQSQNDLFYRSKGKRNKAQRAANKTVNNAWVNAMGDASAVSEEYLRLAAFISGAKRAANDLDKYGMADGGAAAAALVKATHFDYSDLSRVEQDALKFLVPFYVWTRNNVPLQFRALVTQPKYALTLEKAQEGLAGVFADDSEYGQMLDQYMPNFSRDRMSFVTPWNPTGGGQLTLGVESPAMDINKLFAWGDNPIDALGNTVGRFQQEGVSGMNPLIKGAVEAATGRDSFTGASLDGTVDAPNWARALGLSQSALGEEEPQVNARLANFLKDLVPPVAMAENLVPVGQPDRNSDRYASSFLSTVFGAPFATLSPDQVAGQVSRRNDETRDFLKGLISEKFPNITQEQYEQYYAMAKSQQYTNEELYAWLERANASQ